MKRASQLVDAQVKKKKEYLKNPSVINERSRESPVNTSNNNKLMGE